MTTVRVSIFYRRFDAVPLTLAVERCSNHCMSQIQAILTFLFDSKTSECFDIYTGRLSLEAPVLQDCQKVFLTLLL